MASASIERLRTEKEQIVRTLERNRAALDTAGKEIAKFDRTLATSGSEAESARSDLRKIGYLRK